MRKLLFRTSTLISVILLLVLACQKEPVTENTNEDDATSMSVADAKNWFLTKQQPILMMKAGKLEEGKSIKMKPDWNQAFKSNDSKHEAVESPILTKGVFGLATGEVNDMYESTKNENYLNSVSRLVVLKYKKDKRIVSFIMTVFGDKDYLEKKKFTMQGETYLKRDKDLSGYVFYHSTEGEFVNGWRYKEGKVVGKVEIADNKAPKLNLKRMEVVLIPIIYYYYIDDAGLTPDGGFWTTRKLCSGVYYITTYVNSEGDGGGSGNPTDANTTSPNGNGTTDTNDGLYVPPPPTPPPPCDCIDPCPICGGCLDANLLKSASTSCPGPCKCPKVILDPSFLNTTADCVKKKLDNDSILNHLLSGFCLNSSKINLNFMVRDLNPNINGLCNYNQNTFRMDITIDIDRLNGPSLKLAETILHESFHAYIFGKVWEAGLHNGLCPEPDFAKDWAAYDKKFGSKDTAQHNYMADKYISFMKAGLRQYYNNESYSETFTTGVSNLNIDGWDGIDFMLECLAWTGLQSTDAWQAYQSDPAKLKKYTDNMTNIIAILPIENCIKRP
ncbi:MAG: hypothetical protein NTY07_06160 [Bacteroidia bacterium]|nr:hypothetical protein [Bacteroidia bacterium]